MLGGFTLLLVHISTLHLPMLEPPFFSLSMSSHSDAASSTIQCIVYSSFVSRPSNFVSLRPSDFRCCSMVEHACITWGNDVWNERLTHIRTHITVEPYFYGHLCPRVTKYPSSAPGLITPSPAYNELNDAKETARYKWVLVVTELFTIAVNDFDANKSIHYSGMLFVTELVVSGIQCTAFISTGLVEV